jgi:hypothetical protein
MYTAKRFVNSTEERTAVRARRAARLAGLPVDRPPFRHGGPVERLLSLNPARGKGACRPPPGCAPRKAIRKKRVGSPPETSRPVRLLRRWMRGSGNESVLRRKRRGRGRGRRGVEWRLFAGFWCRRWFHPPAAGQPRRERERKGGEGGG